MSNRKLTALEAARAKRVTISVPLEVQAEFLSWKVGSSRTGIPYFDDETSDDIISILKDMEIIIDGQKIFDLVPSKNPNKWWKPKGDWLSLEVKDEEEDITSK